MGYSKDSKDLINPDVNNGILRTGDIAFKDKDNYYYLVGRKDRYVKIFGLRINLQELEDIIINYGCENMCIQEKENIITIYLKKKTNEKNFKDYLVNLTNLHKSVFKIIIIRQFPLNKNLKITYDKNLLQA